VFGSVSRKIEAESEQEALEIFSERYAGTNISLCSTCANKVDELLISEDEDNYTVEEID